MEGTGGVGGVIFGTGMGFSSEVSGGGMPSVSDMMGRGRSSKRVKFVILQREMRNENIIKDDNKYCCTRECDTAIRLEPRSDRASGSCGATWLGYFRGLFRRRFTSS